ncbi:hypothetical protein QUB60_09610 [Microcoleus sp. A2-C5]
MGTEPIDIQDLTTLRSPNRVYESQRLNIVWFYAQSAIAQTTHNLVE